MKSKTNHTARLGIFILSGLLFLVLLLYMIGKNQDLFGDTFELKARFHNVQGLVVGNNVRYSGIEAGTVKQINLLNDSMVEVVMRVQEKMKPFIRANAVALIGSDGLMGNKVINISPGTGSASIVNHGDVLPIREMVDMDDMLRTLSNTNNDISAIAGNLVITTRRINNSTALWALLNDSSLPQNLRLSAANVKLATARTAVIAAEVEGLLAEAKQGKGVLGTLLKDTVFTQQLTSTVNKIQQVAVDADELAKTIHTAVADVQYQVNDGNGTVNALLKDSAMVVKLNASLNNIQQGTAAFNQNMEALKHNFLFRGYFRKLEKQQKKQNKPPVAAR